MDDAPWIAQHYHVIEKLYQPSVKGVELNLLGDRAIPMKKIWLQQSHADSSREGAPGVQTR
jgi:hypothetical protein